MVRARQPCLDPVGPKRGPRRPMATASGLRAALQAALYLVAGGAGRAWHGTENGDAASLRRRYRQLGGDNKTARGCPLGRRRTGRIVGKSKWPAFRYHRVSVLLLVLFLIL